MTENNSMADANSAPVIAQDNAISTPSVTETHSAPVSEKMIAQSEVGRIAGASRKEGHDKGYEKGYQEALSKYQQQQQNTTYEQQSASKPRTEVEIADLVNKTVAETMKRQLEENNRLAEEKRVNDYLTNVANQLRPKIEAARAKYDDFDAKIADLKIEQIPQVLEFVNSVPNAGDVLYDLSNNPHKLAVLNSLHSPALAYREVQKLSQSLINNETAQNKATPKAPLSTIEPSTVGKQSAEVTPQQTIDSARSRYRF